MSQTKTGPKGFARLLVGLIEILYFLNLSILIINWLRNPFGGAGAVGNWFAFVGMLPPFVFLQFLVSNAVAGIVNVVVLSYLYGRFARGSNTPVKRFIRQQMFRVASRGDGND